MLKGALIGVGHVARQGHLPEWSRRADIRLIAAADLRPEGQAAFRAAYPETRWYSSAEELLSAEALDFVDVCTPPAQHAAIARAALEKGCHVICEKPLAFSPEEIAPLAALAGRRARALVTVHNWRYAPALAKMTELVRGGAVERIQRVRWETRRNRPAAAAGEEGNWRVDPAQSGGGILVDHGWHALYTLRDWLDGEPRAVAGRLETRKHRQFAIEDTADVALDWGGARAEIFLTWAAESRANSVAIEGDRASLTLEGGRLALCEAGAPAQIWELPSLAEGSHHPEWFRGVVDEFLVEVREPSLRGRNLGEAAAVARLIALARESSRLGGEFVLVPP